jgi:ATP-binding protein involved in chromosome partitioning
MIARRLEGVNRLLLVLSGKGGVGKSVVSATTAALLANDGLAVGLLDADLFGPSSAFLFGAHTRPGEGKLGLIPRTVGGVRIMSVDLYAPGMPVPLTGEGSRQVVIEMLALTHWRALDYLVIDMPPATSDIMMTLTALPKKEQSALVVTTPDRLSVSVANRVLRLLRAGCVPVAGVVGNMHRPTRRGSLGIEGGPRRLAGTHAVPFLGNLPYDSRVVEATREKGINELLGTKFADSVRHSIVEYLETKIAK